VAHRREQRERQAPAEQRRKRVVAYGVSGALAVAATAVVAALLLDGGDSGGGGSVFPDGGTVPGQRAFELKEAADLARCGLKDTASRGKADRLHTDGPGVKVDYRGNPPTLGRHWPPGYQAEDGLYTRAPADEALVHTMEHGRVIVWVKPTLPDDARRTLRALFDEDSYQLVMVPRRNMPYAVAATAWNRDPEPGGTGRTLMCPSWDQQIVDALRVFRDEHRSNGPEPVP
jgi:hypothetical protein